MKKSTKIITALLVISLLAVIAAIPASADIIDGLESAKDEAVRGIANLFNKVIAPIIAVIATIAAIFFGVRLGLKHGRQEDYSGMIVPLITAIVIALLFAAWSVWGGGLFGSGGGSVTAAVTGLVRGG